jgi:hypothetical protein
MVVAAICYLAVVILVSPPVQSRGPLQARTQEVAGVIQRPSQSDVAAASTNLPAQQSAQPLNRGGLATGAPAVPRAIGTLDVRIGPGDAYAAVGLVPPDGRLDVVGRNERGDWIAIVFTPGSTFHGWVPVSAITGIADVMRLPVVQPSSLRPR